MSDGDTLRGQERNEPLRLLRERSPGSCSPEVTCSAAEAVGRTGILDSPKDAEVLLSHMLAVDSVAHQDCTLKLKLWKPYISVLKHVKAVIDMHTAEKLLAVMNEYVRGGIQSLIGMDSAPTPPPPALSSLTDILLFFAQRLGATVLILADKINSDSISISLWNLCACRGSLNSISDTETIEKITQRILSSRVHPENSEVAWKVFASLTELRLMKQKEVNNANHSMKSKYLFCATWGYAEIWRSVFFDLLAENNGSSTETLCTRFHVGVRSVIHCLDALCVEHCGSISDEKLLFLCREVGQAYASGISKRYGSLEVILVPHVSSYNFLSVTTITI